MSLTKSAGPIVLLVAVIFIGTFAGVSALADKDDISFGQKIGGTYILDQHGETGRSSYTFTEFGSVIWGASDQKYYGYFPGGGAWKQVDDRSIAVRIVSFDYDDVGIGIVDMIFNFDDEFQSVTGIFKGKIYPMDVNVNTLDKDPIQEFNGDFTGVRLTVVSTD